MPAANYGFILWATLGIVALTVVGFLLARRVRSWMRGDESAGEAAFSLQDLRALRARGEITEVEYESMRAAIIGQVAAAKPPRAPAGRSPVRPPAVSEGADSPEI